jgi:prephenate dehydrogenase
MSIKQFFLKQAAKVGTRNLPKDQQELILRIIEKNPKLFEQIAKEIKELTDKGKPEMYATFEVMQKHQKEMQEVMKDEDPEKLKAAAASAAQMVEEGEK